MIIEPFIAPYSIFIEESILDALKKICANRSGMVFVHTESGILEGIMTDGDFRRWVIEQPSIDLTESVASIMSQDFISARDDMPAWEVKNLFTPIIKIIPIIDDHGRLVSVAMRRKSVVQIDSFVIDEESQALIIAEIGNNHNGSLEHAKFLVEEAKAAGADCAKFQMRQISKLYSNSGNPDDTREDLGSQYVLNLLNRFSLSNEDMFAAFDHCRKIGILPLCTAWDEDSLRLLEDYGMPAHKVASADLTNHQLIRKIIDTGKSIILSTGMSTEQEIKQTVQLLQDNGAIYILLHCNSTYPAPFKDIRLKYMSKLKEIGDCQIGYSGHERDINVAIAAVSMGAKVIEKHFTSDREMEGNDHKVSLLPNEFKRMVIGIRQVEEAMGNQDVRTMTQGELMNREILAKSLIAIAPIQKGEIITGDKIGAKSPGKGLQPNQLKTLIGKPARRDMYPGDFFYDSDLDDMLIEARDKYTFGRPWGIPVRYHDFKDMLLVTQPDLLEFHLSYKDLDENLEDHFGDPLELDLIVHSPELFSGDHLLDLCCKDESYRRKSISELQRVIDITRKMKKYFPNTDRPMIVTNVGGFTFDRHLTESETVDLYSQLADSLNSLDSDGIEIIPQTMPPFPWHFGGQRFHNLFVNSDSIINFCETHKMRVCLDISHSKLACNFTHHSFQDFLSQIGPYTAHLHVADATGFDGEGLQIDEGEIDFISFFKVIDEEAPNICFIPEIWQGHKNAGEGFWNALDRLEKKYADAISATEKLN